MGIKPAKPPPSMNEMFARSTIAMEQIAGTLDKQEEWMKTQWPQLVDTLNSDFILHNQRVEQLCQMIDASNTQMMAFRTEVWGKMWTLFERILLVAIGVISAIAGWRILGGV